MITLCIGEKIDCIFSRDQFARLLFAAILE